MLHTPLVIPCMGCLLLYIDPRSTTPGRFVDTETSHRSCLGDKGDLPKTASPVMDHLSHAPATSRGRSRPGFNRLATDLANERCGRSDQLRQKKERSYPGANDAAQPHPAACGS